MSFQSWIEEFYPVDAVTFANTKDVTDEDLINHALKKWTGALPENTKKHGVCYYDHEIRDPYNTDHCLTFAVRSCTLCVRYDGVHCEEYDLPEEQCPIIRTIGLPCDRINAYIGKSFYLRSENNPAPMIELLEKTLEFIKHEGV